MVHLVLDNNISDNRAFLLDFGLDNCVHNKENMRRSFTNANIESLNELFKILL